MIMSIFGFEEKIVFKDGYVNIIEIYNKKLFYNIIKLLNCYNSEYDNQIVLYENDKRIEIEKNVFVLSDIFNIDYNSKKIINKLYNIISDNVYNRQDDELENINLKLRSYLIEEINELPFEFSINSDIDVNDILKLYNLKIDTDCYDSLVDNIEYIINIISTLKIASVLVIPNLKVYLDEKELLEIYKYSIYNNVRLLIIENNKCEKIMKYERKNIIDEEFDEI